MFPAQAPSQRAAQEARFPVARSSAPSFAHSPAGCREFGGWIPRSPDRRRPPRHGSDPAVRALAWACAPGTPGMPPAHLRPGPLPAGSRPAVRGPAWEVTAVRNRTESAPRAERLCEALRRPCRSFRLRTAAGLRVPTRQSAVRTLHRLRRQPWSEASPPIRGRRRGLRS